MTVKFIICPVCKKLINSVVIGRTGEDVIEYKECEKCMIEKFCSGCGYKMTQLPIREVGHPVVFQCPKCGKEVKE